MKEGFRQSMAWLHTWTGLLVSWVLFTVFAGGTAAYFKDEITFWMKPELHRASLQVPPAAEVVERAVATLQQRAPNATRWFITLPTEREPGLRVGWFAPPKPVASAASGAGGGNRRGRFENAWLDPSTGATLAAARETRGGEFFYRLHFDLHYMPAIWARWIVGFCAMFMLTAIVSGVITHRRIFADFFTFRPKKGQRSWLDAHNAVAVLALPYHLMITYTGIVTLMFMYMPWGQTAVYKGDQDTFVAEVFPASGPRNPKSSGQAAPLTPITPVVEKALAHWNGAPIGRVTINNPNDAKATIGVQRQEAHDMSSTQPGMLFNGVTGALIETANDHPSAASETRGVLYGLHLGRFGNPLLRALFFLSGIAGCLMVATGALLWATKAREKHERALKRGTARRHLGLRLVDGLNVAAIAGLPLAMAVFFWANRLVPVGLKGRPQMEIDIFFAAWALAAVAGLAWPKRRMWQAQLGIGGALFAAVPLLNAWTTETHLGVTLAEGLWRVAGFDLVCLAIGAALIGSAVWLGARRAKKTGTQSAKAASPPPSGDAVPPGLPEAEGAR